jgi:hypothetical protein
MNRDKFIDYLKNPDSLNEENVEDIKGVLQEYPWFQTAHILLVKALDNIKDLKFGNQLKFSSAHIGNRHILFNLIHRQTYYSADREDVQEFAGDTADTFTPVNADIDQVDPVTIFHEPELPGDGIPETEYHEDGIGESETPEPPGFSHPLDSSSETEGPVIPENIDDDTDINGSATIEFVTSETEGPVIPENIDDDTDINGSATIEFVTSETEGPVIPENIDDDTDINGSAHDPVLPDTSLTENGEAAGRETLADRILREIEEFKKSHGLALEPPDAGSETVREPSSESQDPARDVFQIDDNQEVIEGEPLKTEIAGSNLAPLSDDPELLEIEKNTEKDRDRVLSSEAGQEDSGLAKDQDPVTPDKADAPESATADEKPVTPDEADAPESATADEKPVAPDKADAPESESHSFSEWMDRLQPGHDSYSQPAEFTNASRSPQDDLIDRFLREKPRIEPRSPLDDNEPPVDLSGR